MRQLDALTLRQLARELSTALTGARVSKIQHLARHELTITFWGGGLFQFPGRHRLYLNLGAEFPCAFLASAQECRWLVPEPLEKPTGLCMLLRKHLGAARCLGVEAPAGERCLDLTFDACDDFGERVAYRLSIELMGKRSNLLLVELLQNATRTQRILGAARYVGADRDQLREIAPGLPYAPPPRAASSEGFSAPWLLKASTAQLAEVWALSEGDSAQARARLIQERFWGLGGPMLAEIVAQSPDVDAFARCLRRLAEGEGFAPACLATVSPAASEAPSGLLPESLSEPVFRLLPAAPESAQTDEFSAGARWIPCESVHALTAAVALTFWRGRRLAQARRQTLERLARQQRRLQTRLQELDAEPADDLALLRAQGDRLLTALSMGELPERPTQDSVALPDLATGEMLEIPIDPALSWRENAERRYRRLKKARARRQLALEQAQTLQTQALYLAELTHLASQADSLADLSALADDLRRVGALGAESSEAASARRRKQALAAGVQELLSDEGVTLLLGRSAAGNAAIVGKRAHPDDYWLHARQTPGSHVLVKSARQPLSEDTLAQAAQLAAHFSAARGDGRIDVIVAPMRHVRKIPDSYPGHVTYRHERTLSIRPDSALVARLIARLTSPSYNQTSAPDD
ncbi:MAG: DUF814 domain-containing protein [Vampirovibrionales bacterium]|nr:DUF814 domain-containing protein [Vampirovibrionales bacterium]